MIALDKKPVRTRSAPRRRRQSIKRVAVIGNYPPRRCGIATFTADLCESLAEGYPDTTCLALPINDAPEGYAYPPRVRFELAQNDLGSYRTAAEFLNINNIDLVCLQHEYGIFGGPAGSHILALLRDLRTPLVTTLHTVLDKPEPNERYVLEELAQLSDRLIVMSRRAVDFLKNTYQVDEHKIDLIPHGIHDVPFVDPSFHKDRFGLEGKIVLLTFGLLSPNKGIENVIRALPAILERYPNVVYTVVGATHPNVQLRDGESYRFSLERLARKLGLSGSVIFHNRFVSVDELIQFIGAADIYITPYLHREQIVSGSLAYTLGAGKAVISTPYWYAEELLAQERGLLVPFGDSDAIAAHIIHLLENEAERHAMRKRAYLFGREMIWPAVAARYMESFERARDERSRHPRMASPVPALNDVTGELPPLKLDHLENLSDDTGVLQHAIFTDPNYDEGYTTDDNARALVLAVIMEPSGEKLSRTHRYQAFLWHAFDREKLRFHNYLSYDRRWLDEVGSEDSQGRALWALGTVLGRSQDAGLRGSANRLFDLALPGAASFSSPRAWAFALLGIHEYLKSFSGDRAAQTLREELTQRLINLSRRTANPDWNWFEDILSYCNARLPHALLVSGRDMGRDDIVQVGLASLQWLVEVQHENSHFVPIGCNGFYRRGAQRARFDQQPVEAHATVSACLEAWRITHDRCWHKAAQRAFEWFLGRNDLGLPIYDAVTGGCRDGLHADRVNQNEGAESTLSFLIALEEMRQFSHVISTRES